MHCKHGTNIRIEKKKTEYNKRIVRKEKKTLPIGAYKHHQKITYYISATPNVGRNVLTGDQVGTPCSQGAHQLDKRRTKKEICSCDFDSAVLRLRTRLCLPNHRFNEISIKINIFIKIQGRPKIISHAEKQTRNTEKKKTKSLIRHDNNT